MLPTAGVFVNIHGVPAMLDLTLRELALAAAIVFILSSFLIDRQVLQAVLELFSSYR